MLPYSFSKLAYWDVTLLTAISASLIPFVESTFTYTPLESYTKLNTGSFSVGSIEPDWIFQDNSTLPLLFKKA